MIIGLDVGGTHTDAILIGEEGLVNRAKVLTDTNDLFESILAALDRVTKDVRPDEISHAVLSTTLTTNAIVTGGLKPAGMIVCAGPGISLDALKLCDNFHVVDGAIDHGGTEIKALNEGQIRAAASRLKENGISCVGVVGKFSTRNPAHELKIAGIIEPMFEKVFVGHQMSGNLNFPRRIATTYLNASVYPIHKSFFSAVESSLVKRGLSMPIHILKADGGTMDFKTSIDFPGESILSGPAASVMGSVPFSDTDAETISLDIGGTTTDMAVLVNSVPLLAREGIEINGYKTLIRSLRTMSVPVGGDSAVSVEHGKIVIGPDRKGPAMAYGGPVPTPTDALFVLGRASEGDRDAAARGMEDIAEKLGLSIKAAAYKVFDKTCRLILDHAHQMIKIINSRPVYTVREALKGHTINPDRILVLGGPAAYFAEHIRSISDYTVKTVPNWDVANAVGTALSRTTCEVILFAETEKRMAFAPAEGFSDRIGIDFDLRSATDMALTLLQKKALAQGADIKDIETDLIESLEFNRVKNFYKIGKNIRVRIQVRPGLIHNYRNMVRQLEK